MRLQLQQHRYHGGYRDDDPSFSFQPAAAAVLFLTTILLTAQRIQVVACYCYSWPRTSSSSSFATSISHLHAGHVHCNSPHFQRRRHHFQCRKRQISLRLLGSDGSSSSSSSGIVGSNGSRNDNDQYGHGVDEEKAAEPIKQSGIRLNKVFKATHSRREADALIESGRVCVNGVTVEPNNLGRKVLPFQDVIALDGNIIYGWEAMNAIIVDQKKVEIRNSQMQKLADDHRSRHRLHNGDNFNRSINDDRRTHLGKLNNDTASSYSSSFEYIKYYKPVGVTCTTDSRIKDNIIYDLTHNHGYRPRHRVYPVGRLDKETSGLILLTSDGRVVNSVLRGENKHAKVYNVMVNDSLTEEDLQRLRDGIVITTVSQRKGRSIEENTLIAKTKKAIVERIGHNSCRISLVEGRNRQIRKMMEALGLRVVRLHRVEFMGIRLLTLRKDSNNPAAAAAAAVGELRHPGDWAYLDEREMNLVEDAIRLAEEKQESERWE